MEKRTVISSIILMLFIGILVGFSVAIPRPVGKSPFTLDHYTSYCTRHDPARWSRTYG